MQAVWLAAVNLVVVQLPGGIGSEARTSLDSSVAELRVDEPIAQPLILITMDKKTPEVRRVIEAAIAAGKLSCSHLPQAAEREFPCNS
jgi:hypothetical protein